MFQLITAEEMTTYCMWWRNVRIFASEEDKVDEAPRGVLAGSGGARARPTISAAAGAP